MVVEGRLSVEVMITEFLAPGLIFNEQDSLTLGDRQASDKGIAVRRNIELPFVDDLPTLDISHLDFSFSWFK